MGDGKKESANVDCEQEQATCLIFSGAHVDISRGDIVRCWVVVMRPGIVQAGSPCMRETKSTTWDGADQKWQGGPASASPEKSSRAWIGSVSGRSVVYAPNEGFSLCIVGNLSRILTLRGVHVRPSLAADLVDI